MNATTIAVTIRLSFQKINFFTLTNEISTAL